MEVKCSGRDSGMKNKVRGNLDQRTWKGRWESHGGKTGRDDQPIWDV